MSFGISALKYDETPYYDRFQHVSDMSMFLSMKLRRAEQKH